MRELDLSGLKCPLPALKTRQTLRRLAPGSRLCVRCTDPMSVIDVPNAVREAGDVLEDQRREDGALVFVIRKRQEPNA